MKHVIVTSTGRTGTASLGEALRNAGYNAHHERMKAGDLVNAWAQERWFIEDLRYTLSQWIDEIEQNDAAHGHHIDVNSNAAYVLPWLDEATEYSAYVVYIVREPYATINSLYWMHPAHDDEGFMLYTDLPWQRRVLRHAAWIYRARRLIAEAYLPFIPDERKYMLAFDALMSKDGLGALQTWLDDVIDASEHDALKLPHANSDRTAGNVFEHTGAQQIITRVLHEPLTQINLYSVAAAL